MEEKRVERKEEIVVLDEGMDLEVMAGPAGTCCNGAFSPVRA